VGKSHSAHGGDEKCTQNFVWKSEGKRPHARPRRKWEENIQIDLRETGFWV
jgi:hypothetical protein